MNHLLALLCAFIVVLALAGCKKEEAPGGGAAAANAPATSNSSSSGSNEATPEAELKTMMEGQLEAMNKEDVDGYMTTVDTNSPAYAPTKGAMKKLFDMYDLRATLNSFELVSQKGDEAEIRTVITTTKIKGPTFNDNKVTALHKVKKKDGKWVVEESKIENIAKP